MTTRTALEAFSETAARARQSWQGARLEWPDAAPKIRVSAWYERDVEHVAARALDSDEIVAEGSLEVLALMQSLVAE